MFLQQYPSFLIDPLALRDILKGVCLSALSLSLLLVVAANRATLAMMEGVLVVLKAMDARPDNAKLLASGCWCLAFLYHASTGTTWLHVSLMHARMAIVWTG